MTEQNAAPAPVLATLKDIAAYFGMTNTQLREEWTPLSEAEREYFKVAVGEAIHGC